MTPFIAKQWSAGPEVSWFDPCCLSETIKERTRTVQLAGDQSNTLEAFGAGREVILRFARFARTTSIFGHSLNSELGKYVILQKSFQRRFPQYNVLSKQPLPVPQ